MADWVGIKHALNSTLGTNSFESLDKMILDKIEYEAYENLYNYFYALYGNNEDLKYYNTQRGLTELNATNMQDAESKQVIIVANGTQSIVTGAFANCSNTLKQLFLPKSLSLLGASSLNACHYITQLVANGLTIINNYAFNNCNGLKYLEISNAMMTFGTNIFNGTTQDIYIKFNGTKSEWDSIGKSNWKGGTGTITVRCNDGNYTY